MSSKYVGVLHPGVLASGRGASGRGGDPEGPHDGMKETPGRPLIPSPREEHTGDAACDPGGRVSSDTRPGAPGSWASSPQSCEQSAAEARAPRLCCVAAARAPTVPVTGGMGVLPGVIVRVGVWGVYTPQTVRCSPRGGERDPGQRPEEGEARGSSLASGSRRTVWVTPCCAQMAVHTGGESVGGDSLSLGRHSPEVQLQLCVQEVDQRPPGHDLCVAVVDHQPLIIDVLPADALGARGQDDDLRLPDVQAWGTERVSDPSAPPRRTEPALPSWDPDVQAWKHPVDGHCTVGRVGGLT